MPIFFHLKVKFLPSFGTLYMNHPKQFTCFHGDADMLQYSDERLVLEAVNGSQLAFEHLVKQYQYHVLKTASSILKDEQAAQDVTQEVFLAAYVNLAKLKDRRKFGGWLTQIAINLARRWLRDGRQYRENTDSLELTEPVVISRRDLQRYERDKLRQEIWDAIDELPDAHREVVILHYISGYSYKEIAQMLSTSVSTVLGRLQKARDQLRKEFLTMITQLQLEIDSALYHFLKKQAEQMGTSVEGLVLRLIEAYKKDMEFMDELRESDLVDAIPISDDIDPEPLKQMVRDFFEALIHKDYERANAIAEPFFDEVPKIDWGKTSYADVVEVLSIGEPFQKKGRQYAGGRGVYVPYDIRFASGYVKKWRIAMRNDNPDGRWLFDGGL
jgi:RNA polymerase sigma-70 factor (ECF subfamily)